jgi:predicted nucleic acid-binding protein
LFEALADYGAASSFDHRAVRSLAQVPGLVQDGRLQLAAPTSWEVLASEALPDSLGLGEREAIALCKAHGWVFLTNDRRARNFCAEVGVEAFAVAALLRLLWTTGVRSEKLSGGCFSGWRKLRDYC